MRIEFTAMGLPTAKGRPRFRAMKAKNGKHFAQAYTDKKTANAENSFLAQALPHKPAAPFAGPLRVWINAYYPIPASYSKAKRADAMAGRIYPMNRRDDADNVAKLCLDALNGVFWQDDTQVVSLYVQKRYCEVPRVWMEIEEVLPVPSLPM